MEFKTDVQIAQEAKMEPIVGIAEKLGIDSDAIEQYGKYKAKIDETEIADLATRKEGKLILVTAITPTPAGEGKTTTVVGLGDGLQKIGKKAAIALREPSLGPVFGMKGGAAGGGYAQVVPMEDLNLHFTGDFHAIGAANNLLAAMLDNHIHHGNSLAIDTRSITWKRVVDMNDRQLRFIVDGLNGKTNGVPREDGFTITVASEIMAILCLSMNMEEMKAKLKAIIVGYTLTGQPVTAGDLKAHGAMAVLLKDALKPNIVQTLEHTPAFVHGGPFANIAHGCNSIKATRLALKYADYVVTEAGFGADLGAEKFMDIKCRLSGIAPAAVVVVATVRALKMHGGMAKKELVTENLSALEAGMPNLMKHIENMQTVFGMPTVVAINKFPTDTTKELALVEEKCQALGVNVVLSDVWENGGNGGQDLARAVVELADQESTLTYAYELEDALVDKMTKVVQKVYGGEGITLAPGVKKEINRLEALGFGNLPICMAKTQYSFSDDKNKLGRPKDFTVTIKKVTVSAGAGFIVVLTGDIMTMPGLPKVPAAESIDIMADGRVTGLF
ncbi:Formate-tetrahydrofolate ligase [Carnobacterium alterfunditum]|uniref:Formate--tetrahydrofolate ligase n=1 Tax=Carnobacterium alterfunditum TaxID=28230 RepID=A0A1N6I187_9LACT|nr:formate--tetrahydrofolate ligase [Carnobacterium alterfunditum]SIO25806.1 Formate-tetrahydrofolate ligase [Carnobacterium alterfunditum]